MRNLLNNRDYFLLWLMQVISGIGDVLYNVGVMVTIFERTGSALQTAGVLVATTLPQFLLGLFAGAVVDGTAHRRVLLFMDLLRALLVGLLLFFVRATSINVWGSTSSSPAFRQPPPFTSPPARRSSPLWYLVRSWYGPIAFSSAPAKPPRRQATLLAVCSLCGSGCQL